MFVLRLSLFCFFLSPSFLSATEFEQQIPVRFVTEANYYPFEYFDEQSEIQGFDIDIANAICDVAYLSCSFHHQSFDSLLLSLKFGRFDAAIAALDITEKRLKTVDFSDVYYENSAVFVSLNPLSDESRIAGKFIGVQVNSSNQDYLTKFAKNESFIIAYASFIAAISDLNMGKIDAVFTDKAVAVAFLRETKKNQKFSFYSVESEFVEKFSDGYGIAVKKGNHVLQQRINIGLKMIIENGTYQQIFDQYFTDKLIFAN